MKNEICSNLLDSAHCFYDSYHAFIFLLFFYSITSLCFSHVTKLYWVLLMIDRSANRSFLTQQAMFARTLFGADSGTGRNRRRRGGESWQGLPTGTANPHPEAPRPPQPPPEPAEAARRPEPVPEPLPPPEAPAPQAAQPRQAPSPAPSPERRVPLSGGGRVTSQDLHGHSISNPAEREARQARTPSGRPRDFHVEEPPLDDIRDSKGRPRPPGSPRDTASRRRDFDDEGPPRPRRRSIVEGDDFSGSPRHRSHISSSPTQGLMRRIQRPVLIALAALIGGGGLFTIAIPIIKGDGNGSTAIEGSPSSNSNNASGGEGLNFSAEQFKPELLSAIDLPTDNRPVADKQSDTFLENSELSELSSAAKTAGINELDFIAVRMTLFSNAQWTAALIKKIDSIPDEQRATIISEWFKKDFTNNRTQAGLITFANEIPLANGEAEVFAQKFITIRSLLEHMEGDGTLASQSASTPGVFSNRVLRTAFFVAKDNPQLKLLAPQLADAWNASPAVEPIFKDPLLLFAIYQASDGKNPADGSPLDLTQLSQELQEAFNTQPGAEAAQQFLSDPEQQIPYQSIAINAYYSTKQQPEETAEKARGHLGNLVFINEQNPFPEPKSDS